MSTQLSVLFYSKKAKATTDGLVPIYLRVTINGVRFEVSTKRYVDPVKWSSQAGKLKGNSEEARGLNSFLDSLRSQVYNYQQELIREGKTINIENFRNKWLGTSERKKTVVEVFKYHNEQLKALVGNHYAPGTLIRYETSLQHTISFMKWKFGVLDMNIEDLRYQFLSDYEFYLKTIHKCNQNTTVKYLGNFRKVINICRKHGWLEKDPFFGYKMTKFEVEREFLTEAELQTIYHKEFSIERLTQVRDIFVFSCFTGLAYADVQKLKRKEVALGIDGGKWIYTHRQKTESASRIPLLPIALEIIEKYKEHPQCLNEDRLLPVLSNQKMNSYLKEIADLCSINKNLTFHIARHTFATTVTLGNGIPRNSAQSEHVIPLKIDHP